MARSSTLPRAPAAPSLARWLPAVQAAFFVVTGLWPVVHMPSFLAITGPKTDLWLVQAFGLLITAVGAGFAYGAAQRSESQTLAVVGFLVSAMLAFIDVFFVAQGQIRPIYLADAAVELAFALGWLSLLAARH